MNALREALKQWKCPGCGGSGKYQQDARGRARAEARGKTPDPKFQPDAVTCKVCNGDGLNPTASAALRAAPQCDAGSDILRRALGDIYEQCDSAPCGEADPWIVAIANIARAALASSPPSEAGREAIKQILVEMIQRHSSKLIVVDYETTIDRILALSRPDQGTV